MIFKGGTIIPSPAPPGLARWRSGRVKFWPSVRSTASDLKTEHENRRSRWARRLMPGFIDPHHHTILASLIFELLDDVGYANFPTRGKLLAEFASIAARTPPGQWISCSNFDNLLQGGDLSREELDAVSTSHPIFVWYTNGHDACVNSMALKVADIPDESARCRAGDISAGTTRASSTASCTRKARSEIRAFRVPENHAATRTKAVSDYLQSVAAVGNTTVHEPGTLRSEWIAPSRNSRRRRMPHQRQPDVRGHEGTGALSQSRSRRESRPTAEFPVLALRHQDRRRRVEPDRNRRADRPYLDSEIKGTPNFDARNEDNGRSGQGGRNAGSVHCNGDYTIDSHSTPSRPPMPPRPPAASTASNIRRWRGPTRSYA